MEEETKVAVVPVEVKTPETTEAEPLIDNRRAEIENLVIAENANVPSSEPETVTIPAVETPKEEVKSETDPVENIKQAMQKRINKLTAKTKTAEEELAEARAEIERLKANPKTPEVQTSKDDTPPTPEQVEAYIVKMREEGNVKEEVAATRYLIKLEKELALKEVQEAQTKTQRESEAETARTNAELKSLANDYVVQDDAGKPDIKSELTLANKNGLLYKTAMSLYNDHELHKDFYDDKNVVQGFRRAVADAYREIHQQGLIKNTPKGETVTPSRNPRLSLADPSAEVVEETTQVNSSNSLSDAEKVREEIKNRNKNRFKR